MRQAGCPVSAREGRWPPAGPGRRRGPGRSEPRHYRSTAWRWAPCWPTTTDASSSCRRSSPSVRARSHSSRVPLSNRHARDGDGRRLAPPSVVSRDARSSC